MSECDNCKQQAPTDELVIDHLLPKSHTNFNHDDNLRMVHRICHRRQGKWYWQLWWRITAWFGRLKRRYDAWLRTWLPCPKEMRGYRCHHRTYPDGSRECGDE